MLSLIIGEDKEEWWRYDAQSVMGISLDLVRKGLS